MTDERQGIGLMRCDCKPDCRTVVVMLRNAHIEEGDNGELLPSVSIPLETIAVLVERLQLLAATNA